MEIRTESISALLFYYHLASVTSVFTQERFPTDLCQIHTAGLHPYREIRLKYIFKVLEQDLLLFFAFFFFG